MVHEIISRAEASGINRAAALVLFLSLLLSLLHHIDHALRIDHSGWPFRAQVTPFTYSLMAYPIILFALFGPRNLFWLRWILLAGAAGFVVFAHSAVESPIAQFTMWAENYSVHYKGMNNALNIESSALGVAAVVISMGLNGSAVVAAALMLRDGLHQRRNQTLR